MINSMKRILLFKKFSTIYKMENNIILSFKENCGTTRTLYKVQKVLQL